MKKILFITLGWFFVVLAVIGIFLPVMPTTPFLILAAMCFNQSSPRFYAYIMEHPIFGPPILAWKKNRVIGVKVKIWVALTMVSSAVFVMTRANLDTREKLLYAGFSFIVILMVALQKSKPRHEKDAPRH